jgi:hypothetical protein
VFLLWAARPVCADEVAPDDTNNGAFIAARPLQRLADQLPAGLSDNLEVEGWVWLSDLQDNFHPSGNFYDAELSLSISKSFAQRVAVGVEGNLIDSNGSSRIELEQGYISVRPFDLSPTILTVGKFNANFGIEPRDFWNRRTGTTSLLFSAQPQDLIGAMISQPIGETGVTVRPFISADFQGAYMFDQPPSAGVQIEYKPARNLKFSVTNWVGPGMVLYGGRDLRAPYDDDSYGENGDHVVDNWQGPVLYAQRGGTLYFVEGTASWQPIPELTLAAEYLFARTSVSYDDFGWQGWMVLADYHFTDHVHVFARYSALNDSDWLMTEVFQKCSEASCGVGYAPFDDVELRAEYRHDFSNVTPDFDSVSIHLTFAF